MYFISKKRSAGFARRALRTNDRAGSLGGEIKVGGGSCLLIEGNLFLIPLLTLFLFLYDPGGELAG